MLSPLMIFWERSCVEVLSLSVSLKSSYMGRVNLSVYELPVSWVLCHLLILVSGPSAWLVCVPPDQSQLS